LIELPHQQYFACQAIAATPYDLIIRKQCQHFNLHSSTPLLESGTDLAWHHSEIVRHRKNPRDAVSTKTGKIFVGFAIDNSL
jgi:hypothetical protein